MEQHAINKISVQENTILRTVYNYMSLGLAITGGIAFLISRTNLMVFLARNTAVFFLIAIAQLVLVVFLSARVRKMSPGTAFGAFILYASLNGIVFSFIFMAYTGTSIAATFLITAGTFAGMSLYGLRTKEDLSVYGRYLIMGLWGVILASVVNIFLQSSGLYWFISYAGVLVFVGLTAYDTQTIARWSREAGDSASPEDCSRIAIIGALKLYLDFINLFLMLLRILGGRR